MAEGKEKQKNKSTGRGVKISAEIKAKALVMLMEGNTLTYIHDKLGIAISTIGTWKKQFEKEGEFEKVRNNILKEQWDKYLLEALVCQEQALKILSKKLDNALLAEQNRTTLIKNVLNLNKDDFEASNKTMRNILCESISDVARVFALMTEKVAIMSGKSSHNLKIDLEGNVKMKFEDFNDAMLP